MFDFDDLDDSAVTEDAKAESNAEAKTEAPPQDPVLIADLLSQLELELGAAGQAPPPRLSRGRPPALNLGRPVGAETAMAPAGEQQMVVSLLETEEGGAAAPPTGAPAGAAEWLGRAREWLKGLNPKARVPPTVQLPTAAITWEPAAAVIYAVTQGQFDPQRDVPKLGMREEDRRPGLVSVLSCTSDGRRAFHPMLYENFRLQTYEPRELVVVHTGEMPSEFFQEKAVEDPRVIYRFFPVTREAPGSPRLVDEQMKNPMAAVLQDDVPSEVMHWEEGSPFGTEITVMGWTKGLKRNIACCIATGTVMANFDDGCLYAPEYLSKMVKELPTQSGPAAITLATWYYLGIQEKLFRHVDLRRKDPLWEDFGNPPDAIATDKWQHGFNFVYTRKAWERHPFSDWDSVGTGGSDFGFLNGLRKRSLPVELVRPTSAEALAACGWHRDSVAGNVDNKTSINASLVLEFIMYRGEELDRMPRVFKSLSPALSEVSSALYSKRERYLNELVEEHGPVWVCAFCNFSLALDANMSADNRQYQRRMQEVDAQSMTKTYDRVPMKFDITMFSKAGGAMGEGKSTHPPPGHPWASDWFERMANCRNCGSQLGWRFESKAAKRENTSLMSGGNWELVDKDYGYYKKVGQKDEGCEVPLEGPLMWGLIGRHLRLRKKTGEFVPSEFDQDASRHKETNHNQGKSYVCPQGHRLRRFPCGQGNGACRPMNYICDICDRGAKSNWHMWGCGTCDYDICDECYSRRERRLY